MSNLLPILIVNEQKWVIYSQGLYYFYWGDSNSIIFSQFKG